MIIIFDLDDTLYDESTYVESSFRAVSTYLSNKYSLQEKTVFEDLVQVFSETVKNITILNSEESRLKRIAFAREHTYERKLLKVEELLVRS